MALLDKLRSKPEGHGNLKGIEFKEGDIIDQRYLVRNVRRGFMGLVYIARDLTSEQTVALKTFQKKFTWMESAIANFTREAEVWMRLGSHPNIVQANRILTIAGRPHIVLEFVPGQSLRELMKRGRLRFSNIIDFAIQICWGMQYAYDHCSIIHRDLKPDNVMITPEGEAKVTDFGLAQAVTRRASNSTDEPQHQAPKIVTHASDLFGGSQPYMSPEQRVPGTPLGTWSDIYALGVMLYEIMVGDLPFRAATVEELTHLHCNVPPPTPSEVRPSLRRGCDHVLLRCLAKKPEDRYQSFNELEADLQWLRKYHVGEELPRPAPSRDATEQAEAAEWNEKGIAHFSLQENGLALKCFRRATELHPKKAAYWINMGQCLLMMIHYDEALRTFNQALALDPARDDLVRLWVMLGEAHEHLYQIKDALEAFDQAIVVNAKERRAWLGRGRVYEALALPKEAQSAYKEAVRLDPNDPQTHVSLGRAVLAQNQPKYAIKHFEDALQLNPRDPRAWCGKGQCLLELRRPQDALSAYETAYRLDPNLPEAVMGLTKARSAGI